MPSIRDPRYVLSHINRYKWEPWLQRPFEAFMVSLSQDTFTREFMEKVGIKDAEAKACLFQDNHWYTSHEVMDDFGRQLEPYLKKNSIKGITKSLESFHKKKKAYLKKLVKQKKPIEQKMKEVYENLTTCFTYIWLTHGIEAYYAKKAQEEVPKYFKGDIDQFIGDASFPKKKNCVTKMEDMMRKGASPKAILKKYGWLRIRDVHSEAFNEKDIIELIKHVKPIAPHKKVIIPKQLKKLFDELQELVYFRTARTDVTYELLFLSKPILNEAAAKLGIPLKDIRYYTLPSLVAGKPERYSSKVAFAYIDGRYMYQDGPIIKEESSAKQDSVKGMIAYKGLVKGSVKIVTDVSELDKVKPGDILVTQMTFPSFIPAMQKAIAFVTDEGGITCHAAIVAREMKKPCVIGTKIATKVFKDGDIVEVDANTGIVKRIK